MKAILGHLEASWGRFGVDFGLILGSFFGPQPEKQILWKTCSRLHGSMIFKGPRGSKNHEKRVRKQCAAGGVLQERLGRLSGSIWEHFELHFGPQNRPKSKLKFEAIFFFFERDLNAKAISTAYIHGLACATP